MRECASAIGLSGGADAAQTLVTIINNRGITARDVLAAAAIGNLCSRDKEPWNLKILENINYLMSPETLYDYMTATGIFNIL
ncbi:MAG: hypothetical protein HY286_14115 [Planctomycetes bacterium]|nr:hypothetical protein [Planctomycetota bacterium]